MSCSLKLLLFAAVAFVPFLPAAEDKKDERKKETPKITMSLPFVVAPGTNKVVVRGVLLTNATTVYFPSATSLTATIVSRGKATVPEKADVKKVGDTQLEAQFVLPEGFPPGEFPFVVSTPDGDTNTNFLYAVAADGMLVEKEPNPGFHKANDVSLPCLIRGAIQDANDVDVFQFKGRAGDKVAARTLSSHYGSLLDPILTIFDADGHTLKTSDDAKELDADLTVKLPRDGTYFVVINDAHDRGGATYVYAIQISKKP